MDPISFQKTIQNAALRIPGMISLLGVNMMLLSCYVNDLAILDLFTSIKKICPMFTITELWNDWKRQMKKMLITTKSLMILPKNLYLTLCLSYFSMTVLEEVTHNPNLFYGSEMNNLTISWYIFWWNIRIIIFLFT